MQVIYIDTLFLINFIINYLILLCTARICGAAAHRLRIALGGIFGGLYAAASVFGALGFLASPFIKIGAGIAMVMIAFGGQKKLLKVILVFFAVAAAFGGAVLAVSLLGGGGITDEGFFMPVTLKVLILSFGASYAVISIVFTAAAKRQCREIDSVTVEREGRSAGFKALRDTGNSLADPITGRSVMVAEASAVAGLFDDDTARILTLIQSETPVQVMEMLGGMKTQTRFLLVPYSAVGSKNGMLLAFFPDKVLVNGKARAEIIVAVSPNSVSENGEYSALIGADE